MDRRGWLKGLLLPAGGSLLAFLGVRKAPAASFPPVDPAAVQGPTKLSWRPCGRARAGRVTIAYTQDMYQDPDGTRRGGPTKVTTVYERVVDDTGVVGWFSRSFSLLHHWNAMELFEHLERMLRPGEFDLTAEERALLVRWKDSVAELYQDMVSGVHKDVPG